MLQRVVNKAGVVLYRTTTTTTRRHMHYAIMSSM